MNAANAHLDLNRDQLDLSKDLDLREQALIASEVSDEALEAIAYNGAERAQAVTVAMCTGNLECPF